MSEADAEAGIVTASVRAARTHIDDGEVEVVVSDLDGVLRVFDDHLWTQLDTALGAEPGTSFASILGHPFLEEVTRGRGTHAQWRERAIKQLMSGGIEQERARAAVTRWADTPAEIDESVLALLTDARDRSLAVFVFTNGTDRVREELETLGLGAIMGDGAQFLLNSADLGHAKPEQEAFRLAHQRIEQTIGHEVPPQRVLFLDDSAGHVHGAQRYGWQAVQHR